MVFAITSEAQQRASEAAAENSDASDSADTADAAAFPTAYEFTSAFVWVRAAVQVEERDVSAVADCAIALLLYV